MFNFQSNPLKDFRTPMPSMRNWFDPMVVIRKREDLGNLIHDLTEEQNPGLSDSLPDIKYVSFILFYIILLVIIALYSYNATILFIIML